MAIPPALVRLLVPQRHRAAVDRLLDRALIALVVAAALAGLAVWLIAPWAGIPTFILGMAAAVYLLTTRDRRRHA